MEVLKNFIIEISTQRPSNCVSVYFSRRITTNGVSKYSTHQPCVANDVQLAIIDTVFPYIEFRYRISLL